MMMATWRGPADRSGPSVAGTAAFDIGQSLNGEDFLFLGRKQRIDLRNRPIGGLLHIFGEALLIVLGYLLVFLEFFDDIQPVTALEALCAVHSLCIFILDFLENHVGL